MVRVTDVATMRANARWHMTEARALLVDATVDSAATYLEYAMVCLDLAEEGFEDMGIAGEPRVIAPGDPVMVRAIGGALSIIGTILARSNLVPLDELGKLFGIFATISADDDPAGGKIIAAWGETLLEAARKIGSQDEA